MPVRLAPRHAAVEREPGPGQAEGIVLAEADAGAVGEAEPLRLHLAGRPRRRRAAAPHCAGLSSSAQARWLISVSILRPSSRPRGDLLRRQAEPVDAGVDHHVAGQAGVAPARDLLGAVQHRPRRRSSRAANMSRAWTPWSTESSRSLGQGISALASAQVATKKCAAARRLEPLHRLARAEPIAVRLDRRAAFRAAAPVREPVPVGDERLAVERETQRSMNHGAA